MAFLPVDLGGILNTYSSVQQKPRWTAPHSSTASSAGFQACGEGSSGSLATESETALGEAGTNHRLGIVLNV